MKGKRNSNSKKVTIVHSYEDRPAHLSDPLKHPDPNEIVPASKAPGLNLKKKLFFCGSTKCGHDIRDHKAITGTILTTGNTAGACKLCHCTKYKFTGKVDQEPIVLPRVNPKVKPKVHRKFSKEHRAHMAEGRRANVQKVKKATIRDMLKKGKTFHEISDKTHAGNKMIIAVKKDLPPKTRRKLRKVSGGVTKKPAFKRRKMKPWMKRVGVK